MQHQDIIRLTNQAYDRGGADVLKILLQTSESFSKENEGYDLHDQYLRNMVEAVRGVLNDIVLEQKKEPESLIHTV